MDLNSEILVELSNEEIEDFQITYKKLNRRDLTFVHLYLKNQLLWNKKFAEMNDVEVEEISDRCKMKLFRHRRGKKENRTVVGITPESDYTVFIASLDESLVELREVLMQTKLINWDKPPLFTAINRSFHKMLYEIFETKNVRVLTDNYCSSIWMDKKKASGYEFSVPDNVEMKILSADDSAIINDVWPYRYLGSEKFIKSLIRLNGGLGIYEGGQLVSWILKIECFGLGLLQTLDEHQGKGYARLLTRALSKKIALEDDEDVILFASYGKPKTVDLYIRYGFHHVCYTHWMYLKKSDS